ncbi:MAG TPA: protein kinase [Candidatus Acidoferrum sp.]|nr:protein kinase [Candidatus Acidoferrum sp.]
MALAAGTRCGRYEITSLLGTGGMGEVYRAKDLRLGRDIAIKLLPDNPVISRERLDRFEQEARSASALNHPNIVTIYELGQVDSTHYIAMELIEGRTLRELLGCGSMPVLKVIQIAAQIADGLAKAHEVGIIHRDLKPENLMVSSEGFAKILDFGVAKLAGTGEFFSAGTIDLQTCAGAVLGTIEYMSPEQARGGSIDFRSDQFSFGLVLYEMVTGKRAYQRSTKPETLVAILREEPEPIGSLSPDVPIPLCWVIERCLAREPEKRYISTRDLARDLASMRDHLPGLPLKPLKTRPSNLPPQRTGLVGRDLEVAAAKELLRRPNMRLVTVTGPAGIGKTRLALQLAGEMTQDFPGGVYFAPLAAVGDPSSIASVIVQTLGIPEDGGQSPLETLKEFLQNSLRTPMLIVLDNFEHLISAAPMLAELFAIGGSGLKFLVTSRAPLHVYGEQEFPVPPLALPDPRSLPALEALSQYSAIALFVQRASAVKPDFELTEQNASAVAEICARLDGLPLAIELAAARIKLLSPSAMRTRLASRLQLLTGGARDLPTRQQTLRGAIDWSYDLLNAAEQKLFRRLSVFVGGGTLEAVEAVCNTKNDLGFDLLDGMASIVDKSLVQQVDQPAGDLRFLMLETIREYALEKLTASGEGELTKRAHAAYYLVLAEEGASDEAGAESSEWLNCLETEHNNLLSALDWLTDTGNADWALRLGTALFRFWETREYLTEGRDRLGKILKLEGAVAPTEGRVRALFAAGVLAGEQGNYASADTLIDESLQIARKLGDQRGVAVCLNALAVHARDRGDIAVARRLFEECLALWRGFGDPLTIARSLSNLASIVRLQGDYANARSFYAECLSIFRKSNNRTGIAWSLNYQGDVARDQGDVESARSLYEEGLDTFRELGDRWGMAGSLADLGNLARDQENYDVADSLYRESMRMFQALGHKRGIARVLECFACSAAAQRQPARSLRLAGAAAALRQTVGAALTPSEQVKLERGLEPARQTLTNSTAATVWFEGWTVPVEKAIEEVLMPHSAGRSVTATRGPDEPAT